MIPAAWALDAPRHIFLAAPVEVAVAIVDDGQRIEGIEEPGPERSPGMLRRGLADGLRPEAGARPVGDRLIEGNAGDRDIDALEVAGVFAPHEGEGAGIARLDRGAGELGAAECGVARQPAGDFDSASYSYSVRISVSSGAQETQTFWPRVDGGAAGAAVRSAR